MSIIAKATDPTQTGDYTSKWWNSKFKFNETKGNAGYAPTPKGFNIQVALIDIVGSPDASSKIQIISSIRGQSETVYYEQAITAENLTDAFLFENVQGNEFEVKIFKGAMTSYTPVIDYDTVG